MGKMCEDIKATPFFEEILNTTGKVIDPHTNVLFPEMVFCQYSWNLKRKSKKEMSFSEQSIPG